jgi:glucosamine--fructose-6-phosphate aminotransferase (isomerizing)
MCGIVGYVGPRAASNIIVSGLHRLEYRGYDSAGIALLRPNDGRIKVVKTPGKITALEQRIGEETDADDRAAMLAIGHTRWATHGPPNEVNAHPHLSGNGRIAIVHNGIIENYVELKARLTQKGHVFRSETDSEVIAHMIEECYSGDLRSAVATAIEAFDGTYGIAVISADHPDTLVAARKGSPIAVGICEDESIVASDVSALINYTQQVIFLDDGDVLTAKAGVIDITSSKNVPVTRPAIRVDWDIGQIEKGGYPHFMLKEIHEQPSAIANATRGRLLPEEGTTKLAGMQMDPRELAAISRITIVACGTSCHAGMVGKYYFEDFASVPTDVEQAAEFRYRNPIIQRDTCMLAISQSGETADTLAAVREAKRKGSIVLGICNVVGSTIAREAERGVYLHAGPEICVASTKAFTCQVTVMAMMAILLGRTRRLSVQEGARMVEGIAGLPGLVTRVLEGEAQIRQVAEKYAGANNAFYIGRGYMLPAALEGALKLKEISYVHAEGYHAAELKHGPIALLQPDVPVVVAVANVPGKSKTVSNMLECRARKAPVIAIATEGDEEIRSCCNDVIWVPPCQDFLAPVPVVVAMQLLAYYIAKLRGCPIDQPRNLAKSVTVE